MDNLIGDPNGSARDQLDDGVELDAAGVLLPDEDEPDEDFDEEEDEESEDFDSLLADDPSAEPVDDEDAGVDELDEERLSVR